MLRVLKYVVGGIILLILVLVAFFVLVQKKNAFSDLAVLHNLRGYDVNVSSDTQTIAKNGKVLFTFTVQQNGVPAKLLEKKIYPHAAVVSNNLRDIAFYHVDDLQLLENDTYAFEHKFVTSGEYEIWIELNNNTTLAHHGKDNDYIARMDLSVTGDAEDTAPARLTSQDNEYRFELILDNMKVGTPSTFRIVVTREDGKPVKLLKDIDHFFYAANPELDFYVLDHPDLPLTKDNEATISTITFPASAQYAFWLRLFPDDGSGEISSSIRASFVLPRL